MASVVTRTRNRHAFLVRAVEGILSQSYANWEHIVVNDGGSAEALEKLLAPFAERYAGRLKLIHLPVRHGMQEAANAALAEASGEFVAIHDDDDCWHPDFLAEAVNFLVEKGPESPYRGVVTQTVRVWEDVDETGHIAEVSREPYQPLTEVNLFRAGYENPFPPIAFLYRRSAHAEIGLFNPAYSYAADLDFNLRFLARWEIGVIQRPLAYYHWRRSASEAVYHNTVTAEPDVHGRLLNEWLNASLRSEVGGDPAKLGLAMNLSRYAVGTRVALDAVLEKNREELERLDDLKNHLSSLSDALSGDTSARLADLKAHLASLSEALSGDAVARLADLKAHLTSVSQAADRTEQALAGRGDDIKNHLSSLTDMLGGDAVPRIGAIAEKLEALALSVDAARKDLAENGAGVAAHLALLEEKSCNTALFQKLDDFKAHLTSLSDTLSGDAIARLADLRALLADLAERAGKTDAALAAQDGELRARLEGIAEGVAGGGECLTELRERLDRFVGLFTSGALPRLEELRTQLAGASANLIAQNVRLASLCEAAPQIARNSEEALSLLTEVRSLAAGIAEEVKRLAQNSVTRADHEALRSEVGALRTELAAWREESARREKYWRIGRLRIGWKSGE
jgi:glycosyltransferase involved in cell wall biosynthesis